MKIIYIKKISKSIITTKDSDDIINEIKKFNNKNVILNFEWVDILISPQVRNILSYTIDNKINVYSIRLKEKFVNIIDNIRDELELYWTKNFRFINDDD